MNTEKTVERINSLTGELSTLAHKLRGNNDCAGYLTALVAAQLSIDLSY